jgi:hypothetical protein
MKALLLIIVILCGAMGSVVAQKRKTIVGDFVVGELTGKDEATREITIKYPGKEGPEMFSGILADDYKLKMAEGSFRVLSLSDIVLGLYIRAFYKTGNEKVNGQEKKINKISHLEILGEDEFSRLRNQLKVSKSVAIAHAENGADLPASSPLKVYLASAYNDAHQDLIDWIDKWNRKNGDSYGKLEISDLEHADTLIVVARGSDTGMEFAMLAPDGKSIESMWARATAYLVVKDAERLKVLWTKVGIVQGTANSANSFRTTELVTAEIEKRMKARARNSKK